MTTLRLMVEYDRLEGKSTLSTDEVNRKSEVQNELAYRNERK